MARSSERSPGFKKTSPFEIIPFLDFLDFVVVVVSSLGVVYILLRLGFLVYLLFR